MSMFPFIDANADDNTAELPLLREYAYDFDNNRLLLDSNGKTYLVDKNEALRIWIYKALATERYHYTAHSHDYGEEYTDMLLGETMDEEVTDLEMERYITEALMPCPYIERLDDFEIMIDGPRITASFVVTSIYGKEQITLPVKEVRR